MTVRSEGIYCLPVSYSRGHVISTCSGTRLLDGGQRSRAEGGTFLSGTVPDNAMPLTGADLQRAVEGRNRRLGKDSDPPHLPLSLSTVTPKQRTKQMHQDTKSPPPATQTTTLPRSLQLWPGPGRIQTLEKLRLSSIPLPPGFPSHLPFSDILV